MDFPVYYSEKHFVNSRTDDQHFFLEKTEKSAQNMRTFTVLYKMGFVMRKPVLDICCWGYKTYFRLNSTEHEISIGHKN